MKEKAVRSALGAYPGLIALYDLCLESGIAEFSWSVPLPEGQGGTLMIRYDGFYVGNRKQDRDGTPSWLTLLRISRAGFPAIAAGLADSLILGKELLWIDRLCADRAAIERAAWDDIRARASA